MPNTKDVMLSIAQVCQLDPGTKDDATWINPGLTGVVRSIATKNSKTGKKFYPCVIADVTGPETIEISFFDRLPQFKEGDLIDVFGKGLRRTEFNGKAQATIGKDTQVAVIGRSAHEPEQRQAAETGAPAVNGKPQHVNGQTVGMAVKEAIGIVSDGLRDSKQSMDLTSPEFWKLVKQIASNIIRISQSLEIGHLSPPSWPTGAGSAAPGPARQESPPPPPPQSGRSDPPKPREIQ